MKDIHGGDMRVSDFVRGTITEFTTLCRFPYVLPAHRTHACFISWTFLTTDPDARDKRIRHGAPLEEGSLNPRQSVTQASDAVTQWLVEDVESWLRAPHLHGPVPEQRESASSRVSSPSVCRKEGCVHHYFPSPKHCF